MLYLFEFLRIKLFLVQKYSKVENDNKFESVYSSKVRAGKRRTYFFDVRQTKGDDYYITITESTKRFDGNGYERHKIFLYKEDFNRFMNCLNDTVDHVKNDLMPDFDYELYERRQKEWEEKLALEGEAAYNKPASEEAVHNDEAVASEEPSSTENEEPSSDEDMTW